MTRMEQFPHLYAQGYDGVGCLQRFLADIGKVPVIGTAWGSWVLALKAGI
jgi:hypothetical protein